MKFRMDMISDWLGRIRLVGQRLLALFFVLTLSATSLCLAATSTTQFQIFDTVTKKKITCGKSGSKWEAGSVSKATKKFTTFKTMIADLKLQLKDPTLKPKVKTRMTVNMQAMKENVKRQNRLCVNAAKAVIPGADPTKAGSTPTKAAGTPTAKPTTGGCIPCISGGNTTCFRIPSGMTGNVSRGQTAVANCLKCHPSSRVQNLSYDDIQSAFSSIAPMKPLKSSFSNSSIADIAAFVNQKNSKQCTSDWR